MEKMYLENEKVGLTIYQDTCFIVEVELPRCRAVIRYHYKDDAIMAFNEYAELYGFKERYPTQ